MRRSVVLLPVVLAFLVGAAPALAWTWPVTGPVVQPFVVNGDPYAAGQHRGIDIGAAIGDSVVAPATGTVSFAGRLPRYGLTATILTPDGYAVTLLDLGRLSVARGAVVAEGGMIGEVGPATESPAGGPHVHLGIRVASDPNGYVDPLTLLPALATAANQPRDTTGDSGSEPPAISTAGAVPPEPRAADEVASPVGEDSPSASSPMAVLDVSGASGAEPTPNPVTAVASAPILETTEPSSPVAPTTASGDDDAAALEPAAEAASEAASEPRPQTLGLSGRGSGPERAGSRPAPTIAGSVAATRTERHRLPVSSLSSQRPIAPAAPVAAARSEHRAAHRGREVGVMAGLGSGRFVGTALVPVEREAFPTRAGLGGPLVGALLVSGLLLRRQRRLSRRVESSPPTLISLSESRATATGARDLDPDFPAIDGRAPTRSPPTRRLIATCHERRVSAARSCRSRSPRRSWRGGATARPGGRLPGEGRAPAERCAARR